MTLKPRRKIPYAGYDPDEQRRPRTGLRRADVLRLKEKGMTMREIAHQLSVEHERAKDYSVDAIYLALRRP